MDLDNVEQIQFNALGGADNITVNDLAATDVKQVNIDLSATAGSGQGDGAADKVIVNGTAGDDTVTVVGSGGVGRRARPAATGRPPPAPGALPTPPLHPPGRRAPPHPPRPPARP